MAQREEVGWVMALVVKDGSKELPIPEEWRPLFCEIVSAFVARDYSLNTGVLGVKTVSHDTAVHIEKYIQDYGATLTELPTETWETSVCIWLDGHWDVLIDLYTQEEGLSDLVLNVRVTEEAYGFVFDIHMVYVP